MSNIMYLRGSVLTLALLLAYLLTQSVKWVMTEIALLKYTVEWWYKNFLSVIITHIVGRGKEEAKPLVWVSCVSFLQCFGDWLGDRRGIQSTRNAVPFFQFKEGWGPANPGNGC